MFWFWIVLTAFVSFYLGVGLMCVMTSASRHDDVMKVAQYRHLADEGYELSTYAACSKVNNTEEYTENLHERIENFQEKYIEIMKEDKG